MIVLALALLLLATASPLLAVPLRRLLADPTLLVAAATAVLLALAALAAAGTGDAGGWRRAAALVLGVGAATTGGSDVVRATFRLIRRELRVRRRPRRVPDADAAATTPARPEPATEAVPVAPDVPSLETALRGGAWIGYLERAAISATMLAGWPEGIALVLAVKGVGRYPELRDAGPTTTNAPEAFIIGTLVSVLWAAAAAGTATLVLH